MCNDFGLEPTLDTIETAFSQTKLPLRFAGGRPNLGPRSDIMPKETAPIVRVDEESVELVQARWGLEPGRPNAPPVINWRSEGRNFANSRRCLIPASHFYEFTAPEPGGRLGKGGKPLKTKWRFTLAGHDLFCIAGVWKPGEQPAFTMLTTEPGLDIAPYHGRQIVLLAPEDWRTWLDLSRSQAELLRPLAAGGLKVEKVL